jgi:hypothetical protein
MQPEDVVEDVEWAVALKALLQEGDVLSVVQATRDIRHR